MVVALAPFTRGRHRSTVGEFCASHFVAMTMWVEGMRLLPKVPVHYEIAAGSIAQIAHFPSELGISIKEIPQVIGEQVSFGLQVAIPAGIAAALNGAKLQIVYRNNLVKRT